MTTERRCPGRARTAGAPRAAPMWQEAMRRRRYLRDRAEAAAAAAAGGGEGLQRSRDWLYESYYCMSQQHPLIVFLLLIVMGACLALLAVFFALGLVSGLPVAPRGPRRRPCPAPGCSSPLVPCPRPAWLGRELWTEEKFPWKALPKIKLPGLAPGGRAGRVGSASLRPVANSALSPGAAARSRGSPQASLAR